MLGLDDVAVTGNDQGFLLVRDAEQRLQASQPAVRPPVLGEFDRGAGEIAVLLELALEEFKQCERVGGATRESGEHIAVGELSHLPRVALDDSVAQRHLAVATDGDGSVLADRHDGRSLELIHCFLRSGPNSAPVGEAVVICRGAPSGVPCRISGPDAENQDAYRPGWN